MNIFNIWNGKFCTQQKNKMNLTSKEISQILHLKRVRKITIEETLTRRK